MWCDNCCLLLPLRAGAIGWATILLLCDLAGTIFLFLYGKFFYFVYPEWYIYAFVSLVSALVTGTTLIGLINHSYSWIRISAAMWPIAIVLSSIRTIVALVQLRAGESKFIWECQNGGQVWPTNAVYSTSNPPMPASFCTFGITGFTTALTIGFLVDIAFQIYMSFLVWRFRTRMDHYTSMKMTDAGSFE